MKLPKNYFSNLTVRKYREYLKLLPDMQQENTKVIVTLIFTFFAMSFFGIFAINPTLSTIVTLRKQLADSQLVYDGLKTKIATLSSLQQQYAQLNPDLPVVFDAIPKEARASGLLGQVMGLAREKRIKIQSLETSEIRLLDSVAPLATTANGNSAPGGFTTNQEGPSNATRDISQQSVNTPAQENPASGRPSYIFSLKAQGTYDDLMAFAKSLTRINRIITVESLSISKDAKLNTLTLDLDGRTYFQK